MDLVGANSFLCEESSATAAITGGWFFGGERLISITMVCMSVIIKLDVALSTSPVGKRLMLKNSGKFPIWNAYDQIPEDSIGVCPSGFSTVKNGQAPTFDEMGIISTHADYNKDP